jgi:hypothetical protein
MSLDQHRLLERLGALEEAVSTATSLDRTESTYPKGESHD